MCHWAYDIYTKSIHKERIGIKMRIKNGVRTESSDYGNKVELGKRQLLKCNGKQNNLPSDNFIIFSCFYSLVA